MNMKHRPEQSAIVALAELQQLEAARVQEQLDEQRAAREAEQLAAELALKRRVQAQLQARKERLERNC